MSGLEIAMIINAIGAGLGGLFGGGSDQGLKSFDSEVYSGSPIAAPNLMKKSLGNVEDIFAKMLERAEEGVDLSGAFAQAPPTFSGGGLPMPIGVTGRDPFPGGRRGVGLRRPSAAPPRQVLPGTQGPGWGGGRPGSPEAMNEDIQYALAQLRKPREF